VAPSATVVDMMYLPFDWDAKKRFRFRSGLHFARFMPRPPSVAAVLPW
jgi:hypothetical protein